MSTIQDCDEKSKRLLKHVKSAVEDVAAQLLNAEEELQFSQSELESESCDNVKTSEMVNKDEQTALFDDLEEKQTRTEAAPRSNNCTDRDSIMEEKEHHANCKKENSITPHEAAFRNRLVGFERRSSTPKVENATTGHTKRSGLKDRKRQTLTSEKSDGVWSLESKPSALAQSQVDSSTVDFHLVEAVLPKSRRSLRGHMEDCDPNDDELSDGESHSVFTIAKLVSNLNAEKKKSNELEERLKSLQNELDATKIEHELEAAERKEEETSKVAGLVEEIYAAQKDREAAVHARIKLATRERDEALLRAKAYAKDARFGKQDENNNSVPDAGLQTLLEMVCSAESGRATEKYGKEVASRILTLKKERDRITCEEMAAVIGERDSALYKCRSLRREVKALKESNTRNDNTLQSQENRAIKTQLQAAEDERDAALKKLSAAREEMETLNVYYSFHKQLVESGRLGTFGQSPLGGEGDDATRLAQALRVAHQHNDLLESNAKRHEAEANKLRAKNERLDRLVTVLRKKLAVMAQKSARSLMEASGNSSRDEFQE